MIARHSEGTEKPVTDHSESTSDAFLRCLSFIPAGLTIWILHDQLMLVLGGTQTIVHFLFRSH